MKYIFPLNIIRKMVTPRRFLEGKKMYKKERNEEVCLSIYTFERYSSFGLNGLFTRS